MNIFDVLRAPKMSEKTLSLKEEANQESIEKSFKVSVLKVRTMNVRGKKKRLGRYQGLKSSWKKAIVTLKEGDTIEYFEGA